MLLLILHSTVTRPAVACAVALAHVRSPTGVGDMMILRSASVAVTLSVAPIHCEPMKGAGISALVIVAVKSRRRKKRRRMVGGFVLCKQSGRAERFFCLVV